MITMWQFYEIQDRVGVVCRGLWGVCDVCVYVVCGICAVYMNVVWCMCVCVCSVCMCVWCVVHVCTWKSGECHSFRDPGGKGDGIKGRLHIKVPGRMRGGRRQW